MGLSTQWVWRGAIARSFFCVIVWWSQAESGASEDARRLLSELMGRHLHADSAMTIDWEDIVVEGETDLGNVSGRLRVGSADYRKGSRS
jgi:hypothetical protein